MGINFHAGEEWRLPDLTAAYLSVDRDVCRRAFFGEPVHVICEAVGLISAGRDDPDRDPEEEITAWARERGAGVFGEKRHRNGGFQPAGRTAEDLLLQLVESRPALEPAAEYRLYLAGVQAEEGRIGRSMTPSELERFERRFHAASYKQNLAAVPPEPREEIEAAGPSPGR